MFSAPWVKPEMNILVSLARVDLLRLLLRRRHHRVVLVAELLVPVEQLLETVLVLVGKIRVLVDYRPLKPPCALLECQFHVFERILSVVLVVKSLFLLLDNEINNNSNLLVLEVTVLEVILERILVLRQKEL